MLVKSTAMNSPEQLGPYLWMCSVAGNLNSQLTDQLQVRKAMANFGPMSGADVKKRKQMEMLRQRMERKRSRKRFGPSLLRGTNDPTAPATGQQGVYLRPGADAAGSKEAQVGSSLSTLSAMNEHAPDTKLDAHGHVGAAVMAEQRGAGLNDSAQQASRSDRLDACRTVNISEVRGLQPDLWDLAETQPSSALADGGQKASRRCDEDELQGLPHGEHTALTQKQFQPAAAVRDGHVLGSKRSEVPNGASTNMEWEQEHTNSSQALGIEAQDEHNARPAVLSLLPSQVCGFTCPWKHKKTDVQDFECNMVCS